MPLHPSSQISNIKTSLEKYVYDVFEVGLGLSIDYEGRGFESGATQVTRWIQPRILDIEDPKWKPKASTNTRGNRASLLWSLNIFVEKSSTTQTNLHYKTRDLVIESLFNTSGASIPLRDYHGGTTRPWVSLMKVDHIETDQPIPDQKYYQYNVTVSVGFMREW